VRLFGFRSRQPARSLSDSAERAAYRADLEAAETHVKVLATHPPAPLRRSPAQALESIRREAERLLSGEEEADRRRGPGRRATDYRP
jgi:hypothetical protein